MPNGDLASGSGDQTIKIWNSSTGSLKATLSGHNHSVFSLTVLKIGYLASGSYEEVKIWDSVTGKIEMTLIGHSLQVYSIATLLNGDLASGSSREIIIWNISTGTIQKKTN